MASSSDRHSHRPGSLDNQQNLMSQLGMSDSLDSSSEDIIPMQKRRKRSYTRRRNLRTSTTSGSLFKANNFGYGLWTLLRYLAYAFVMVVLLLDFVFIFNVFKRLDLLQLNVQELQSTKSNQPTEMHSMHAQLKQLEMNSSLLRADLTNVIARVGNLTAEVGELRSKFKTIAGSIEAAPAIMHLPKDMEDLKKTVADMGSKMNSDDKEVKMTSEELARQKIDLESLKANFKPTNVGQLEQIVQKLAALNSSLSELSIKQSNLEQWKIATAEDIKTLLKKEVKTSLPTAHVIKKVLNNVPIAELMAASSKATLDIGGDESIKPTNTNM